MIRSMTGYGYSEKITNSLIIKAEFKSLNGKNLELNVRIPKSLSDKELELRNRYMSRLERGTVLISLQLERTPGNEEPMKVNQNLLEKYYRQLEEIADHLGADKKDLFKSALHMPDVTRSEEKHLSEEEWQQIIATCDEAYKQLDAYRVKEGKQTAKVLKKYCREIENNMPGIAQMEEERIQNLRNRLSKNLEDALSNAEYDKNRFEQELIYYLEKWDIQEEKIRLKNHCDLFNETLEGGIGGKKLGFISQEMGREINTLGSKANHAGMQQLVIGMKESLEKIKEQILNII